MNAMKLTSGGAPAHKASMETRSKGLAGAIELVAVMAALPALAGSLLFFLSHDRARKDLTR